MPSTNKFKPLVWFMVCLITAFAYAEPTTVDAAIEAAKLKKNAGNIVKPEVKNEPLPGAVAIAKQVQIPIEPEIKLWSIKGINDEFTAEIIVNNKIHQVALIEGAQFQDWEIVGYDSKSITLHQKKSLKATAKINTDKANTFAYKTIQLFVTPRGTSIMQFEIQKDGEINTLQRRAAANLPANGSPPRQQN
jgi:hypothetical protein